jgi:hypothetical protein
VTLGTALPRRGHSRGRFARFPSLFVLVVLVLGGLIIGVLAYAGDDGTIDGSGNSAAVNRAVPSFSAVHVNGTSAVRITVGPERSVVVHADDNLVERVTTEVDAGVLHVSTRGSFTASSPMYVDVSVGSLDAVTLSGTGAISVQGVDADALRVELPATGTGVVTVTGSAQRLTAQLGGTGDLQLAELQARDAAVTLTGTGTGRIEVHVTGTLRATLSGDGQILYSGSPKVIERVTGTGAIIASPDYGTR